MKLKDRLQIMDILAKSIEKDYPDTGVSVSISGVPIDEFSEKALVKNEGIGKLYTESYSEKVLMMGYNLTSGL